MHPKYIVDHLVGIIVRYSQLHDPNTKKSYSHQELSQLLDQLNAIQPTRVPMLRYFLTVIENIQPYLVQETIYTSTEENYMRAQLRELIIQCQLLLKTSGSTKVSINYSKGAAPPTSELMHGLNSWSRKSGSIIEEKLFHLLEIDKDTEPAQIEAVVENSIKELIAMKKLEVENKTLSKELSRAKALIAQLQNKNQELQLLSSINEAPSNMLFQLPLTPKVSPTSEGETKEPLCSYVPDFNASSSSANGEEGQRQSLPSPTLRSPSSSINRNTSNPSLFQPPPTQIQTAATEDQIQTFELDSGPD